MFALERLGKKCVWFDKRKKFIFEEDHENKLCGYLLNVKKEKFYHKMLGLSGRHWMVIKWVDDAFFV